MASSKAEKTVGTQLSGQVKKEPVKVSDGAAKSSSKSSGSKKASPKPQEPKKKGKGGKPAAKH
ncbi:ABC transporter domain-containing protein [Psidium guajava]|nr:ABC transporter domain-containing protein [Psidium guajava]